jgi:8-oxo-dGTP diphosphatase
MTTDVRRPTHASEAEFLARYRPGDFPRPAVAVDLVVMTVLDGRLAVLLVRRGEPPFEGRRALPGGFVRVGDGRLDRGEDLVDAARRELREETGLDPADVRLEQIGAFGRPDRDPRMRVITIAYSAVVRPDVAPRVRPGGDAAGTDWSPVTRASPRQLAFDHREILDAAIEQLRGSLDSSDVARHLVSARFSVAELRAVREILTGEPQDRGNFRRRFQRLLDDGVVVPVAAVRRTATKPAQLYRFASVALRQRGTVARR